LEEEEGREGMVEVSDGMLCRELIFLGRVRIWRAEDRCVVKRMIPLKYPLFTFLYGFRLSTKEKGK